jgi:hypothetical protein
MILAEDGRYIKGPLPKTHFAHRKEFLTIVEFASLEMSA